MLVVFKAFKLIGEAYSILSDCEKRNEYDDKLSHFVKIRSERAAEEAASTFAGFTLDQALSLFRQTCKFVSSRTTTTPTLLPSSSVPKPTLKPPEFTAGNHNFSYAKDLVRVYRVGDDGNGIFTFVKVVATFLDSPLYFLFPKKIVIWNFFFLEVNTNNFSLLF